MIPFLILFVSFLSFLLTPHTSSAWYIEVTSLEDQLAGTNGCTLRGAIDVANANGENATCTARNDGQNGFFIQIAQPGTITLSLTGSNENLGLTGDLDLRNSSTITIVGAGINQTILDGNQTDRIFHVLEGATATISSLTLQNGLVTRETGGGILNQGTLTLQNVLIQENRSLRENFLGGEGGGIANQSQLFLGQSTVYANRAFNGGGLYNVGTATIERSTISSNDVVQEEPAIGQGGAIFNIGNNNILIESSTLSRNRAGYGGGILMRGGSISMSRSLLTQNRALSPLRGILYHDCSELFGIAGQSIPDRFQSGGYNIWGETLQRGCPHTAQGTDSVADDTTLGLMELETTFGIPLHALQASSSGLNVIPEGDCFRRNPADTSPASDQRAKPRPQGAGCEPGAYEYDPLDAQLRSNTPPIGVNQGNEGPSSVQAPPEQPTSMTMSTQTSTEITPLQPLTAPASGGGCSLIPKR